MSEWLFLIDQTRRWGAGVEIDARIARAVRDIPETATDIQRDPDMPAPLNTVVWTSGTRCKLGYRLRRYTSSLDAAKGLYPVIPEMIPSDPLEATIQALRARHDAGMPFGTEAE